MGLITKLFPDAIARGAVGGHGGFNTIIVQHAGGYETPDSQWQDARGRWNLSQAIKKTGAAAEARDYFYMARARFHHWPMRDWTDWNCARASGRAVATGASTFQLSKVYGDDPSFEYVRPLYLPIAGTVQAWRNGAGLTLGVGFTVDTATGIVTLASPISGDTIECAFDFYCRCRFDTDSYSARLIDRSARSGALLIEWDNIDVIEVRPPA